MLNEALHWNGKKWSLATTPDPAGTADTDVNQLFAIRCTSARDCWAVGDIQLAGGPEQNQAMHWNGTRWSAR